MILLQRLRGHKSFVETQLRGGKRIKPSRNYLYIGKALENLAAGRTRDVEPEPIRTTPVALYFHSRETGREVSSTPAPVLSSNCKRI